MQKLLLFVIISMSLFLSSNVFAEKSYVFNIPSGAASPDAPYFWQSEKDGNTQGVINVLVNDTVSWKNADTIQHTVVSGNPDDGEDGIFNSNLIKPGASFSYKFTKEGKFDYFCSIHPWMIGMVTVDFAYQKIPNVGKEVGDGQTKYDIEYLFDRLVTVNSIEQKSNSIMFELVGKAIQEKSNLTLRLPVGLIDGPFTVWMDGKSVSFDQHKEDQINTIVILVPASTKLITIEGTHVVPEFSSMVITVFGISILSLIIFSNKIKIF